MRAIAPTTANARAPDDASVHAADSRRRRSTTATIPWAAKRRPNEMPARTGLVSCSQLWARTSAIPAPISTVPKTPKIASKTRCARDSGGGP